jgi:uncharacterized protein
LIVVSDTSPILNLARIRRLSLLPALYHVVIIPSAVADELKHALRDLSPSIDFDSEPWLMVRAAAERNRVRKLQQILDPGEAEAIALALECRAALLLVDERRARKIAAAAGLTVTGLLGVIAAAKQAGPIPLAKPVLDELIHTARFWLGAELYAAVLSELGQE